VVKKPNGEVIEMPDPVKKSPILKQLWKRVHLKEQNLVFAVVGDTGSGKSLTTSTILMALDPSFDIDRVCWTPEQVMKEAENDEAYSEGDANQYEEGGVGTDSRQWFTDINQALDHVFQTWREQQRILGQTLPSFDLLDKRLRKRCHYVFEMDGINRKKGYALVKVFKVVEDKWSGDIYRRYPRLRDPKDGVTKQFKRLKVALPPQDFIDEFKEDEKEFKRDLISKKNDELEDAKSEKDLSPQEVADVILEEGRVSDFMRKNGKQRYMDKDSLYFQFKEDGLTQKGAKQVKSIIYGEKGWDDKQHYV